MGGRIRYTEEFKWGGALVQVDYKRRQDNSTTQADSPLLLGVNSVFQQ